MSVNTVEERILAAARYKLNMDEKVIQAGMFDQKSTGSDRRQFLQAILQNDEEDEEENEVPEDETVNQMLARTEEEFEQFQVMDKERASTEPESRGLMQEIELPEWMLKEEESEEDGDEDAEEELGDRRARSKKEVDYTESLTEKEWLRAIGANMEEEEDDDGGNAGGRSGSRGSRGTSSSSKSKRRKREENDDDEPSSSKPKKRGRPAREKPNSKTLHLVKFLRNVMEIVIKYANNDGRVLSDPFMKLPSRRTLADYYEVIKHPMDVHKIMTRIEDGRYESLQDLERDFMLLCRNAQEYNEENSIIYDDSVVLQSVFTNAREKIEEELANAPPPSEERKSQFLFFIIIIIF